MLQLVMRSAPPFGATQESRMPGIQGERFKPNNLMPGTSTGSFGIMRPPCEGSLRQLQGNQELQPCNLVSPSPKRSGSIMLCHADRPHQVRIGSTIYDALKLQRGFVNFTRILTGK